MRTGNGGGGAGGGEGKMPHEEGGLEEKDKGDTRSTNSALLAICFVRSARTLIKYRHLIKQRRLIFDSLRPNILKSVRRVRVKLWGSEGVAGRG